MSARIKKTETTARGNERKQNDADKLFDSVVKAVSGDRRVAQSKMFGSPGLKLGGKVFAMLVKGKLVVKLPKERVESFVTSGKGEYFDPGHGRLMKEWVSVKPSGGKWLDLAREARDFVAQGRPKP